MSTPTHAYVGYNKTGKAIMVYVDDASRGCAKECAKIIRTGGHIERMPIEQARVAAQSMYKRPTP